MNSEAEPETTKNTKTFISFLWKGLWSQTPYEVNPEKSQYIVHSCADFHIGFSIQACKWKISFEVECSIFFTQTAPQHFDVPELSKFKQFVLWHYPEYAASNIVFNV